VIGEPPLLAGAMKDTDALASPADATTPVGAVGTVDGVTALDAEDCAEVPIPLVAVTLNVYESPLVNPVTTHVSEGAIAVHVPATLFPEV
jgi:hypothetical protein